VPILKSEVALSPPDLFDLPDLPATRLPWRVAHVRSRQEKELARLLRGGGVPFYLPLMEKQVRRAGRRFVSYLPLFPGYLFFRGAAAERLTVLASARVVSVIAVLDQRRLDAELRAVWRLEQSGAALAPHPYLAPGDEVRVVDGPFRGLSGVVLREKGRTRLVVSVTLLRQAVAAELEREALAPAGAGERGEPGERRLHAAAPARRAAARAR